MSLLNTYKKPVSRAGVIVQQVGYLPCTWPTWVWCSASHMMPVYHQEWFLNEKPDVTHMWPQTNKHQEISFLYYFLLRGRGSWSYTRQNSEITPGSAHRNHIWQAWGIVWNVRVQSRVSHMQASVCYHYSYLFSFVSLNSISKTKTQGLKYLQQNLKSPNIYQTLFN